MVAAFGDECGEWTGTVRIITSLCNIRPSIASSAKQRSADSRETRGSKSLSKFGSASFDTVLVYLSALAATIGFIKPAPKRDESPYAAFARDISDNYSPRTKLISANTGFSYRDIVMLLLAIPSYISFASILLQYRSQTCVRPLSSTYCCSEYSAKQPTLSGIFNRTDFMRNGVIRTFNTNRILSRPHCWQHFHPEHLQFLFIAFRLIRIAPRAFASCISS